MNKSLLTQSSSQSIFIVDCTPRLNSIDSKLKAYFFFLHPYIQYSISRFLWTMMYEIRCIISGCVVIACWFIITDVYLSRQSRPSQKTIYHPESLNERSPHNIIRKKKSQKNQGQTVRFIGTMNDEWCIRKETSFGCIAWCLLPISKVLSFNWML